MATTVYILLGSNLGDREGYLNEARKRLEALEGLEVIATSAIYISDAVEMAEGSPSFLNQVVKGDYQYSAGELLHSLQAIESDLDRTGKGDMTPRTIDLDILLFGQRAIETDTLTVPHPKLLERPFALIPLEQIDPGLEHPVTGNPISAHITDRQRHQVEVYKDHVARNV